MTRLVPALRLELTLQVRQKFLHAAVFSGLIWLAVLLPMPVSLRPVAEPYVLVGDIAIIGFFFVGGTVFFEKQERTIGAIVSTPLRFWEYLAAKLTVLLAISLFVAVVVATIVHGLGYHLLPLVAGIVLGTLLMLLVGFSSSLPFASVTDWFLAAVIPLAINAGAAGGALLRPVAQPGALPHPHPGAAALARRGVRSGELGALAGRVCGGLPNRVCGGIVPGGQGAIRPLCRAKIGCAVRAISSLAGPRALAAFGRNDIRGTYRDPLLVMLVIAPVIWTTGVALLTPLFTEMLARRYGFDLVGYYPLILTAFLLLTSIIVAGALAAFLVLDDVDAGTMTALRVTPVPLSVFFGYRAATVMVVTTIYVVATMSCSGILEPGLVSSLIPIGLVAGLSAVVTLLLILAVANNKIQGLAMVRALGMLIAGLPCLPWFISSNWNLAFGVLPPYWAAKAFWVASDHGTWWPYLVGGAVYNLAIVWVLFRRFRAKHA